jgi:streptogramin lyase
MLKRWQRLLRVLIILSGAAVGGATLARAQSFIEFNLPTYNSYPLGIAAGPDGALWFTESNLPGSKGIGRITTTGVITEFTPNSGEYSQAITAGPDGALWFTESSVVGSYIGRSTTAGVITEFPRPSRSSSYGITAGPDGNLWFTEFDGNQIGRITTAGVITEFPIPTAASYPYGIVAGPDGNLWFTEYDGNQIGRITTSGVITEYPIATPGSGPSSIQLGPDGNLWFAEFTVNRIGHITTAGVIADFSLPPGTGLGYMTLGPDGALWFTGETGYGGSGGIGRIATGNVVPGITELSGVGEPAGPITTGPDGALWFTEVHLPIGVGGPSASRIGRFSLPMLQATPATGPAPLPVTFATRVQSPDISGGYKVDFGDGITSPMGIGPSGIACTVTPPCYAGIGMASHTYASAGTYTATLLNSASMSVATVPIVVSGATVSFPVMSPRAAAPPSITPGIVVGGTTNSLPSISSFAATPASITQGSGATLSWSVSGATSLSISGIGEVNGTSIQVSPTQTTNYTLTASNGQRSATAQTTVTVSWYRWRRIDSPSP